MVSCIDSTHLVDTWAMPPSPEQHKYLQRLPDMICSFVSTTINRDGVFEMSVEPHHHTIETLRHNAADICKQHNTEAVLALRSFAYRTQLESINQSQNFMECFALYGESISQLLLILPNGQEMLLPARTDTLFWTQCDTEADVALLMLPPYNEVYYSVAENTGSLLAQQIVPQWETQIRYVLASQKRNMQDAVRWVLRNDWQNAANLWFAEYKITMAGERARIAYNLALYYEQANDIDKAIEWCEKATSFYGDKPARKHAGEAEVANQLLNLLRQRRADFAILDQQTRQ